MNNIDTTLSTTYTINANVDFNILSQASLNDFATFNRGLFPNRKIETIVQEDFKDYYFEDDDILCLPYRQPSNQVQYQINHYVMWGVIWCYQLCFKPDKVIFLDEIKHKTFTYNAFEPFYNSYFIHVLGASVLNRCYACKCAGDVDARDWDYCELCPIWSSEPVYYACERSDESSYAKWNFAVERYLEIKEYATNEELEAQRDKMAIYAQELTLIPWGQKITYSTYNFVNEEEDDNVW